MPPKPMPFMSNMLSTLNLFCLTQCPQDGSLYERWSQCEASSLKATCPRNGCLSAKTFEFSAWNLFFVETWCPKTNAFHVKDVVNIEPFLFDTMPPRLNAFMKDGLNVKPVLLKQNAPKWMPFSKDLFNTQRETPWNLFFVETWCPQNQCLSCQRCCQHWTFFVWHNAPKMEAFMKDGLNVKPVVLKQNAPEMDAFAAKTFQFSAWNLFFVETWCPQNQCLSCQRCCQHWTFFVWHNAPKWMPLWKMVSMWSQFF